VSISAAAIARAPTEPGVALAKLSSSPVAAMLTLPAVIFTVSPSSASVALECARPFILAPDIAFALVAPTAAMPNAMLSLSARCRLSLWAPTETERTASMIVPAPISAVTIASLRASVIVASAPIRPPAMPCAFASAV
jgi:hypothetical protein